jgi:hypothetical protein
MQASTGMARTVEGVGSGTNVHLSSGQSRRPHDDANNMIFFNLLLEAGIITHQPMPLPYDMSTKNLNKECNK